MGLVMNVIGIIIHILQVKSHSRNTGRLGRFPRNYKIFMILSEMFTSTLEFVDTHWNVWNRACEWPIASTMQPSDHRNHEIQSCHVRSGAKVHHFAKGEARTFMGINRCELSGILEPWPGSQDGACGEAVAAQPKVQSTMVRDTPPRHY